MNVREQEMRFVAIEQRLADLEGNDAAHNGSLVDFVGARLERERQAALQALLAQKPVMDTAAEGKLREDAQNLAIADAVAKAMDLAFAKAAADKVKSDAIMQAKLDALSAQNVELAAKAAADAQANQDAAAKAQALAEKTAASVAAQQAANAAAVKAAETSAKNGG